MIATFIRMKREMSLREITSRNNKQTKKSLFSLHLLQNGLTDRIVKYTFHDIIYDIS